MISQRAKYALKALMALVEAPAGASLMIAEISRRKAIPRKFLEQILLELKRAGIVDSRRGRLGGYVLARAPDKVTFGEVLRLIDGPVALLPCLSKIAYRRCTDCAEESRCEIRHVFARVAVATRDVLDTTTLADALKVPADVVA
ncbi:MAG: Rrf2 family transcriptional regulator [Devosia sp.]|nr:Rrf2 family transcriptional regulator [Devosia sp.]